MDPCNIPLGEYNAFLHLGYWISGPVFFSFLFFFLWCKMTPPKQKQKQKKKKINKIKTNKQTNKKFTKILQKLWLLMEKIWKNISSYSQQLSNFLDVVQKQLISHDFSKLRGKKKSPKIENLVGSVKPQTLSGICGKTGFFILEAYLRFHTLVDYVAYIPWVPTFETCLGVHVCLWTIRYCGSWNCKLYDHIM